MNLLYPSPLVSTNHLIKCRCGIVQGVGELMPSELSGGMKKRVALARSIIFDDTQEAEVPEVPFAYD